MKELSYSYIYFHRFAVVDCYATFALTAHRNIEPPMRENYWQRRYEERRELAYKSLDEKFAMNASNRTTENSYAASIDSDDDSP